MRKVHVFLLAIALCLMGCFDAVPDRDLTGSDGDVARLGFNEALKSARLVDIDVGGMTDGLSAGSTLKFALPGSGEADLVVQTVQQLLPGVTTFSGHVADDENSDFTFSINSGKLVGSIRQGTHAWLVEPHASSNRHVVRTIDRTMLPKDEPAPALALSRQRISTAPSGTDRMDQLGPTGPTSATLSTGNVRVLFLYASNISQPSAWAQAANIVAAFNASLDLSAVAANNFLTIADVEMVASDFNDQSRETIRDAMIARAAPFNGIDTTMTSTAADVAFLLVTEDAGANDVPGFGRVGGAAFIFDQSNPFALSTESYALGDLTALHELGHVFGGQHENESGIARPVVAIDCTWMTVMGGYIACPFNGLPPNATTLRLGRWSNPAQTYNGFPLGIAGERDMHLHLESSMPTVSNWWEQAATPAVLTSPAPGSTLPGATVTFSWMTGSGVSQYYLYVGSSVGGADLYQASQGLSTSGTVTGLPTDGRTLYVRLRSLINSVWQFRDYTYTAASLATPAVLTSPAPGSTLPGATVTFSWTTGSGVSQYYLYVGNSVGAYDLYLASQGLSTSGTVAGLPTDGRTLYVRLWSFTSPVWQFRDYTYTASSTCHPLAGTHGQSWMPVSANSQFVYTDGWCTIGNGLPAQCWQGTYFYYQNLQSSYCSSVGSGGSCYDGDAWWWVTCNALVDCIYNCSGQCVKADC